jgi:hypothetical protein
MPRRPMHQIHDSRQSLKIQRRTGAISVLLSLSTNGSFARRIRGVDGPSARNDEMTFIIPCSRQPIRLIRSRRGNPQRSMWCNLRFLDSPLGTNPKERNDR